MSIPLCDIIPQLKLTNDHPLARDDSPPPSEFLHVRLWSENAMEIHNVHVRPGQCRVKFAHDISSRRSTYERCRGPRAELISWITQIHTAAGKVYVPKALWLGPIQQFPKHGGIVRDMDVVHGLRAWQCGRLYPPQGQVSDGWLC